MDPLPRSRRHTPVGVSVAELVSLHSVRTPAEVTPPGPTAPPVSVAALLRREGRGPHAVDPPLQLRAHSRPVEVPAQRRGVRTVTVAAGALLAVSATFGASVLDDSSDPDGDTGEALAVPEPEGGIGPDGAVAADGGVGLATTLAVLPEDDAAPDLLPIASGADIGNDALGDLLRTDPAATGSTPADAPAADVPDGSAPVDAVPPVGGPPVDGPPVGGPPVGGPAAGDTPADNAPVDEPPAGDTPIDEPPAGNTPTDDEPGQLPEVSLPEVSLPDVSLPEVSLPQAPAVTISKTAVDAPDLTLTAGDDGLALSATRTALTTPDLSSGDVGAGPVTVADGGVTLPDLAVESAEPLLVVGAEPEVTVPAVTVSPVELRTPDVELGDSVVELPDLRTPELAVPEVPVVQTLSGVLGG